MDKKTFLEELKEVLSVLQEDELSDILNEYEQHIDMKVHKGLTEEEAIADFGNMKELTAEILEAYHVRADYGAGDGQAAAESEKKPSGLWERFRAKCSQCSKTVTDNLKRLEVWLKEQVKPDGIKKHAESEGSEKRRSLFGEKEEGAALSPNPLIVFCQKIMRAGGRLLTKICRFLGRLLQAAWRLFCLCLVQGWRLLRWSLIHGWDIFLWCVRACWNIGWILFALFCGGFGVFSLFGLGLLIVLLAQGYPLAGATIGALGVNLSLFAAAGFGLTLLWKGKKRELPGEPPERKQIEADADRELREEEGCHA